MVAKPTQYVDLSGRVYALSGLNKKERELLAKLRAFANSGAKSVGISQFLDIGMGSFYTPRGLSRREIIETPVYRVGQDIGSRLGIARVMSDARTIGMSWSTSFSLNSKRGVNFARQRVCRKTC